MGKLTTLDRIRADIGVSWYLPERSNNMTLPCSTFNLECAISFKVMHDTIGLQNTIRQFIEEVLPDTVIFSMLDLLYNGAEGEYSSTAYRAIHHGYYRFFFESEDSWITFALKFSEQVVKTKTKWLPAYLPWFAEGKENIWTYD